MRRIVVTGPECTGKTTLARALATRLDCPWVPEYSRYYAEKVGRPLTADDVEPIAKGQMSAEDRGALYARDTLVLDTDLISTVVYARHYYGSCPAWIEQAARERRADEYLLCDIDLPWTPDGVRDRPEHRDEMLNTFRLALEEFGCSWRWAERDGEQ